MRTPLAYAVSVGLHGLAFGALAYAAAHPEVLTVGFAVRAGDANGALSQARRARHIEASFDTHIAEAAIAPTIIAPAEPQPSPAPQPAPPAPPTEPVTAANLDAQPTKSSSPVRTTAQRTGRGPGRINPSDEADAPNLQPGPSVPSTVTPPASITSLESPTETASGPTESIPDRVAMADGPRALTATAAAVTVQPLEPGNDDFDSINANTPQGARVSQMPSRLPRNREPVYPEDLRRQQIGGTVLLRVTIGADGSAEEVTLAKTSGYPAFDDSALQAVRTWRFDPARRNNIAVRYTVKLPITFSVRAR